MVCSKKQDLAKIISYLTFDGHLAKDLKCFYLSAKQPELLKDFEDVVYDVFKVTGRIENNCGIGQSYKYRVFSAAICKRLAELGTPSGNKTKTFFLVPDWIIKKKTYARIYLRIAFDCEGSIWTEKNKTTTTKIRFGIWKKETQLQNGIDFVNQLIMMLGIFKIHCTKIWLKDADSRRDTRTRGIYFQIKQESIDKFAKEVSFSNSFKKERLSRVA